MKAIDLFAGCGGFSNGFEKAGFNIIKAVEFDSEIAKTYEKNHQQTTLLVDDIRNIDNENFFSQDECDVIIGGPPCQGFSMAGARIREGTHSDPRNYLFKHYFNIVKIVKPKVFVIENVKGILTMDNGRIFNEIVKLFSDPENFDGDVYHLSYKVVKAIEMGIPQMRERVIIIGTKNFKIDIDAFFIKTKEEVQKEICGYFDSVTVWDAISNMDSPSIDGRVINNAPQTKYQEYLHADKQYIENHIATKHSEKAMSRMEQISQGENWTKLAETINSVHSGAYGRLSCTGIAPTITTRFDTPSGGMFTHPYENRTLTPREAARIQSFSDDFVFVGSKSSICKQIGNAVPPKISYFLAILVRRIINENSTGKIK